MLHVFFFYMFRLDAVERLTPRSLDQTSYSSSRKMMRLEKR
jgi:hypothetical protein